MDRIASHEAVAVAPLLIFLIPRSIEGENGVPWGSLVRRLSRSDIPRRVVSGLLVLLVPLSFCPGRIGRFCSYEVRVASFALFPFTEHGTAIVRDHAGDLIADFTSLVITWQLWCGIAIVALVAYLVWRGRALHAFAAGWVFLFLLPFWIIVRCWGGDAVGRALRLCLCGRDVHSGFESGAPPRGPAQVCCGGTVLSADPVECDRGRLLVLGARPEE